MTTLLSPDDLRLAFETDLGDAVLQLIIDDADAAIVERYGAHEGDDANAGLLTEELYGGGLYFFPARRVAAIVSMTEYGTWTASDAGTALETNDYRVIHDGRTIERLVTGTNPLDVWGTRIVIEYTPVLDNARRRRVELDLCKLALQYSALASEKAGDYSQASLPNYQGERERLLGELARGMTFA